MSYFDYNIFTSFTEFCRSVLYLNLPMLTAKTSVDTSSLIEMIHAFLIQNQWKEVQD